MKSDIHPEYEPSRVVCACGRVTETRGTVEEYHVEICSHCHPFFTGKQKLVDTAGRVERFLAKYGESEEEVETRAEEAAARAEETERLEFEQPEEEEADEEEAEPGEEPAAEAEESRKQSAGGEDARAEARRAESGASAEG